MADSNADAEQLPGLAPDGAPALLSVAAMYACDQATIASGVAGYTLMTHAGYGIAQAIQRRWTRRPVVVLAGPGNNGGDGFVVARLLRAAGWPVRVALLGDTTRLKGDAAQAAAAWDGPVESLTPELPLPAGALVVDALFGAGLSRPLEPPVSTLLGRVAESGLPLVAVDMPSGVHGDTGAALGYAAPATLTVTFCRAKRGQYLLPGRQLCGTLVVVDIGIPDRVVAAEAGAERLNAPALWQHQLVAPQPGDHKYSRGHALVVGGAMSGAARLAVRGARAAGAGMVSAVAPEPAATLIAQDAPGAIVHDRAAAGALQAFPQRRKGHSAVIGPGAGVGRNTAEDVLALLATGCPVVLDADALGVFAEGVAERSLAHALAGTAAVLTPHPGEFNRLFPTIAAAAPDKATAARQAAAAVGAVVVVKGYDSVVAAPEGGVVVNANAPAALATAGTGDVLAGLVGGLLARGLRPLAAATAGVWLHGAAAERAGESLLPEDLAPAIRNVRASLRPDARPEM